MILPHELLSYLYKHDKLPPMPDTGAYWAHMKKNASWSMQHPVFEVPENELHSFYPVFLYGDDCQYSENEKLTCISVGFLMDGRTSSMASHYPLCIIREVSYQSIGKLDMCIPKCESIFWMCWKPAVTIRHSVLGFQPYKR